jgi:uroporphyrin-3 C-methyltransferase
MSDTHPTPNTDEPDQPAAPTPAAPTPAAPAPTVAPAASAAPRASPPGAAPAPQSTPPAPSTFGSRAALWLALVALLFAALSLLAGVWLWQKLGETQQEMARRSQDSAVQVEQARTVSGQAEALTKELDARLTVAEVRLSEVSLQRSQLEELMLSLSRSRDDNLVQDLESALRLGQQQSQLTGSVAPLLAALQSADQRIDRAAQPRLNPVQRAIQRDIERVRGAAVADVPSVVSRLDELARLVDTWPVANQVGPKAAVAPTVVAVAGSPAASTDKPDTAQTTAAGSETRAETIAEKPENAPPSATAPAAAPEPSTGWAARWGERWDRAWRDVLRASRDLVRVSRIDQPEAALLAPEQAYFLRENLKLKLLNARLGLLARQPASALADLVSADAALARYFKTEAPAVVSARAALTRLREELRLVELPRPDESLAALNTAAGGR